MATQAKTQSPDLVSELKELKRRLAALERSPDTLYKFDRYPSAEWAATGRGKIGNNAWSSCGVANVTGLVYDRVEVKFITSNMIRGKREAEVRLAAFRHFGNASKECISASYGFRIHGNSSSTVGTCVMRWIHGIPFGWDTETDNAVYTIELQHRYLEGPENTGGTQVYGFTKSPGTNAPAGGALKMPNNEDYATAVLSESRPGVGIGWTTIPNNNDGTYAISNMHYCVGLPADRIPEAGTGGWAWYIGGSTSWGNPGNVNDDFVG